MTARYLSDGNESLQRGDHAAAESSFRQALQHSRTSPDAPFDVTLIYRARHGLAKACLMQSRALPEACSLCESIVAMPITSDRDRRLILDAAYTLTMAFLVAGRLGKAKALCNLLINGERKFPERTPELHESMALMAKVLEANGERKNAKVYRRLLPAGFREPEIPPRSAEEVDDQPPQSGSSAARPTKPIDNTTTTTTTTPEQTLYELGAPTSSNPAASQNPYYDPNMSNAYDPSLTRALLRPFQRMSSGPSDADINYITDFRNPTNPLSPGYTAFVTVPIPMSVFDSGRPTITSDAESTYGLLRPERTVSPSSSSSSSAYPSPRASLLRNATRSASRAVKSLGYPGGQAERYRFVRMSRDEYLRHWARDSNGNYLGTEPEGSGDERMRDRWIESGGKSISQLEYVGHITEGRDAFAQNPFARGLTVRV